MTDIVVVIVFYCFLFFAAYKSVWFVTRYVALLSSTCKVSGWTIEKADYILFAVYITVVVACFRNL